MVSVSSLSVMSQLRFYAGISHLRCRVSKWMFLSPPAQNRVWQQWQYILKLGDSHLFFPHHEDLLLFFSFQDGMKVLDLNRLGTETQDGALSVAFMANRQSPLCEVVSSFSFPNAVLSSSFDHQLSLLKESVDELLWSLSYLTCSSTHLFLQSCVIL